MRKLFAERGMSLQVQSQERSLCLEAVERLRNMGNYPTTCRELGEVDGIKYAVVLALRYVKSKKKLKDYMYIVAKKGNFLDMKGAPLDIFRRITELVNEDKLLEDHLKEADNIVKTLRDVGLLGE